MAQKFYFTLLLLCAILAQSMAIVSEDNTEDASHLHVRQKRVIDKETRNNAISISYAPYIINIHKNNQTHCAATILLVNIAITAAHCFNDRFAVYKALSGSNTKNGGLKHSITKVIINKNYNAHSLSFDLALFKVSPNFMLNTIQSNKAAELHTGFIQPGTPGIFSGWGCTRHMPTQFPMELRAVHIPILHPRYCQEHYRLRNINIQDQHICALDKTGNKGSCTGDDGGPLIIEHNQLVGIFSHRNGELNGRNPEIFMKVDNPLIHSWILNNMKNNKNWFGQSSGSSSLFDHQ